MNIDVLESVRIVVTTYGNSYIGLLEVLHSDTSPTRFSLTYPLTVSDIDDTITLTRSFYTVTDHSQINLDFYAHTVATTLIPKRELVEEYIKGIDAIYFGNEAEEQTIQ